MFRFRLFSVPFAVGPAFWIGSAILGANVAVGQNAVTNLLIWVACVFVSIVVHELGHALVARHYGASPAVELLAFGGITRMFGRELTRAEGFWVTLAGPVAGFGLYLLTRAVSAGASHALAGAGGTGALLAWLALGMLWQINLWWTVFNLLPILPLDGGRLLSALLGPRRAGVAQGVGVFLAASLATLAALNQLWFVAVFLAYLAYVNFQGGARSVSGDFGQS